MPKTAVFWTSLTLFCAVIAQAGQPDPSGWSNRRLAARLIGIGFAGTEVTPEVARWIRERGVGAIVFYRMNTEDEAAFRELTAAIRATVPSGEGPFLTIDQEGGSVIRYEPATLPSSMAIAATGSLELAREAGRHVGCALRRAGITMNLAPVLDLSTPDDRSDLGTRTFSSSPEVTAATAAAYIEGLHQAGVLAAVKHFPGQGHASADPHESAAIVTRTHEQLADEDLVPFRTAIAAGVDAVMAAHAAYPNWPASADQPATFSEPLLTKLLREELGFEGLVITDAINMAGTGEADPGKAAVRAILAGADLVLTHGARYADLAWNGLALALENGSLSRERALASARRVLKVQERGGRAECACSVDPAFPERLARLAVTEIRTGGDVPALADATFVGAPGLLSAAFDAARRVDVPVRPSPPQVTAMAAEIARRGSPVVAAIQNGFQASVIQRAQKLRPDMDLTLILLGSPADAAALRAHRYIFAYSFLPASQKAALEVLEQKRCAPGRLPVDVDGISKRGGGDARCLSSEARESR